MFLVCFCLFEYIYIFFFRTSEKLLSVEDELKQTKKQLKESQSSVKGFIFDMNHSASIWFFVLFFVGLTDIVEKLENAIGSKEDENSLLLKNVESLKKSLENLEKDKKLLTKHVWTFNFNFGPNSLKIRQVCCYFFL